KSEKIRRAAVQDLRQAKLDIPLPADDLPAAESIRVGLTATRDKDTTSPNQIGSGIVKLAYKGRDPQDTRRILEAVIGAYKKELYGLYDKATQDKLAVLDKTIETFETQKAAAAREKVAAGDELRAIT